MIYVKVFILIKKYKDRLVYTIYSIEEVTDYNCIADHFLEVVKYYLIRTKGY